MIFGIGRSYPCQATRRELAEGSERTHVHNATVDISKFLETEQTGPMSRVIEGKALHDQLRAIEGVYGSLTHGGGINGDSSGVGGRIWFLAASFGSASSRSLGGKLHLPSMQLQSIEIGRHCARKRERESVVFFFCGGWRFAEIS
jgi:hypothetical protein